MATDISTLVANKVKGIGIGDLSDDLIASGAIDILEKIKTYKQEDLQKFITEINVEESGSEYIWTQFNATSVEAWEVMGAKRSMSVSAFQDTEVLPSKWKTANRLSTQDKSDFLDPKSLKFITKAYPGYIVESYGVQTEDGDNDNLASDGGSSNYIITIFPQVSTLYHSWKIQYISIPTSTSNTSISDNFHVSYHPALAVYCAKNIVLNEMNRLLLSEEDLELASELKNHYALLEQEYASLMY